ncbi:hypothetical protein [Sphingomonas sp. TWP1-3-1]|uniref:hypothetical protein n=1 Tax=Sphingomonas sp. TWP1-3-1 TaxID=2804612 RepID=UPI003CF10932
MTIYTVAVDQTTNTHHEYEDKQYANCEIIPDGEDFILKVGFSNGKRLDGDHFSCVAVFKAEDDTAVAAASYKCGINATFFGKTEEKHFDSRMDLLPKQRASVVKADIYFERPNNRDDAAIWKAIGEAAKKIYEVFFKTAPKDDGFHGAQGGRGL